MYQTIYFISFVFGEEINNDKEIHSPATNRFAPNPEVVFHENYGKPKPFQNDIALIKLDGEVREAIVIEDIKTFPNRGVGG